MSKKQALSCRILSLSGETPDPPVSRPTSLWLLPDGAIKKKVGTPNIGGTAVQAVLSSNFSQNQGKILLRNFSETLSTGSPLRLQFSTPNGYHKWLFQNL